MNNKFIQKVRDIKLVPCIAIKQTKPTTVQKESHCSDIENKPIDVSHDNGNESNSKFEKKLQL